ncbi:hypothetical protein ACVRZS_06115 [Streptococcus ferus]|nr:hypothetical protein [Streptococcus ferus]
MEFKNKYLLLLGIIICILGIVGGCRMFGDKEETLTREQQDNVVRWIARGYDVHAVDFISFSKDKSTGMYLLSFRLNSNKNYETTISINEKEEFSQSDGILGLNPISRFRELEKKKTLDKEYKIDISQIEITYLEE